MSLLPSAARKRSVSNSALDASAFLALLNGEPGAQQVTDLIAEGAVIGAVNLSEVIARLSDFGRSEQEIRARLSLHAVDVIPFDTELAYQAGLLRSSTRQAGLSFGDRACLALSMQLHLPAVTADRAWERLSLGLTIQVIR